MFHNKKFLFVESIFFILLVVFAFKIGWRETYASLNELTGLGSYNWTKLDVNSAGDTIVFVRSGVDNLFLSSDFGSSASAIGVINSTWVDVYEAGGSFIAVSNSNGEYVYTYNGNLNTLTAGPLGPFTSAAMSDDQNYMVVTKTGQDYYDFYASGTWTSALVSQIWQDSAMSSNGQYTLLASDSALYLNNDFNPGNVSNITSVSGNFVKVAMSDDAQFMVAIKDGGEGVYSNDYGVNWYSLPNKSNIDGIDVSNGGVIVAGQYNGGLYLTRNLGVDWITLDESVARNWADVKINDQGTVVYGVVTGGYVYKHNIDNTAPFLSEGGPTGNLGDGELSTTLQVTTDESATCKYSTTSGTDYSSMEGIFDNVNGTSHTEAISGLSPSTSYTYYVKCIDQSGNINAEDYSISFSTVADSTAPVISNLSPSGTLSEGTTSVQLSLSTNENATCKYASGEALPFNSMTNSFSTTGGTTHTHTVTGLSPDSSYQYYVACEDSSSNQTNNSLDVISFSIPQNIAPEITNISSDKDNSTYITGEVIDIDITFSENTNSDGLTIQLNTGGQCSTGSITNSTTATCNYTVQSGENTPDLTVTSISGSITDSAGNSRSSFDLSGLNLADNKDIVIDTAAPVRSGGYPSGVQTIQTTTDIEIGLTTDETATCKYSTTPGTSYGDMTLFTTTNSTSHTYLVEGVSDGNSYTYYVRCADNYNHENNTDYEISFSAQEVLADSSAPTITSVSSDKSDGTYTVGEVIDIDVTFSEAVTSTGNVTVTLETGDTDQTCTFSVSNSDTGTCNYTVQAGDISSDLTVSSISGTIEDQASNAMADFTPATNLATNKAIVIDTTAPSISSPLPSGAQAQGTTGVTLQVTTDENSTCKYGTAPNTAYASISNTFSTTGGTTHTQSITGLSANTSYTYYVRCTDSLNPTTSDTTISFSIPANLTNDTQNDTQEGSSGSGRTGRRNTSSSSSGSESNNAAVQIVDSVVKKTVEKIDSVLTEFKETIVGDPENKPKILELIDKLKEEFNKLFNRLEETQQSESSEETQNILFTQDLELGDSHPEVKLLQQFLNNNGYSIAPSGPGSKGQETEMFGYATRAALARFQRDNSIVPAVGNFGPITRDLINSLSN